MIYRQNTIIPTKMINNILQIQIINANIIGETLMMIPVVDRIPIQMGKSIHNYPI